MFAEQQHAILSTTKTHDSRQHKPHYLSPPRIKPQLPAHPRPFKPPVLSVTPSDLQCPTCDQRHLIYQCQSFKGWILDKKMSLVRKNKLCFNCLHVEHTTATCLSRHGCCHCGERHHTLLHAQASTSAPIPARMTPPYPAQGPATPTRTTPPPVVKVGGSANAVLMEAANVMVTAGVRTTLARALLDSGASVSLVSSRLVKAIQAQTTPNPVELSGLYSTGLSKCTVDLTLSSK